MSAALLALFIWISFGSIAYLLITNSKLTEELIQRIKNLPDSPVHSEERIRELIFSSGFLVLCLLFALPICFIVLPGEILKKLKGETGNEAH